MTSATKMQSAKVLRIVWQSRPVPSIWKAAGMSVVCACAAFSYLWVSQSVQYYRSTAEAATLSADAAQQSGGAAAKPGAKPQVSNVPIVVSLRPNEHETEFTLAQSNKMQQMGPISIRLRAVHPDNKSYDVTLQINKGHEWNKLNVKVNEPIPLLRGRHSNQLVVYAIFPNRVSGYIERVQPRS